MVHGGAPRGGNARGRATLAELGLPDRMARATGDWQAELSALGLAGGENDLAGRADRILERLG